MPLGGPAVPPASVLSGVNRSKSNSDTAVQVPYAAAAQGRSRTSSKVMRELEGEGSSLGFLDTR